MTIEASRDRAVSIGRGFMENGGGMRLMELLASETSTAEGRPRPSNGRKTCSSSSNKRRTDLSLTSWGSPEPCGSLAPLTWRLGLH